MTVDKPVYVVHAKEIDPPEGTEGVDWLLLAMTSYKDTMENRAVAGLSGSNCKQSAG